MPEYWLVRIYYDALDQAGADVGRTSLRDGARP
jgi:hypothetical protein